MALLRLTDCFTDELFTLHDPLWTSVVYPVSRVVVDPERFLDDDREPMSRVGMGVVYTKTLDGEPLRTGLTTEEKGVLVETYYRPHHEKLLGLVELALEARGTCLILDCHRFPSVPFPYETRREADNPDICLGTDAFHTPAWLEAAGRQAFREQGFEAAKNHPFSGTFVPQAQYMMNASVRSLMVGVNRRLYIDEERGERLPGFDAVRHRVVAAVKAIGDEVLRRAKSSNA